MSEHAHEGLIRYRVIWDRLIGSGALVQMGGAFKRMPCPDDGVLLPADVDQALAAKDAELERVKRELDGALTTVDKLRIVQVGGMAGAKAVADYDALVAAKDKRIAELERQLGDAEAAIREMSRPEPADPPVTRGELAAALRLGTCVREGYGVFPKDLLERLEAGQDARGGETHG